MPPDARSWPQRAASWWRRWHAASTTVARAPATLEPSTLVSAVHSWGLRSTPRERLTLPTSRLGPPGLFQRVDVFVEAQWFWQYEHRSLVVFAIDGVRHAYVPEARPDPSVIRLDRLAGYRVESASRWVALAAARLDALRDDTWRWREHAAAFVPRARASDDPPPVPDVDAAPAILADLARLVRGDDTAALGAAFAVLDALACFRGAGQDNVRPSTVHLGPRAVAFVNEQRADALTQDVRDELLGAASRPEAGGAYRSPSERRVAIVQRVERRDSTVGGHDTEVAVASLTVTPAGWWYERRALWSAHEAGVEKS